MRLRGALQRAVVLALCLLIAFFTGLMPLWATATQQGIPAWAAPAEPEVPPGQYDDRSGKQPAGSYTYIVKWAPVLEMQVDEDDVDTALVDYRIAVKAAGGSDKAYINGLPVKGKPDAGQARDSWLDELKTAALARYARYTENLAARQAAYPQKLADHRSKGKRAPPKPRGEPLEWHEWVDQELIRNEMINRRGDAFHQWVDTVGRPVSPVPPRDVRIPDAPEQTRKYDSTREETNATLYDEYKSTKDYDRTQLLKDKKNAAFLHEQNNKTGRNDRIRYTFAEKPDQAVIDELTAAGIEVVVLPAQGQSLDGGGNPVQLPPTVIAPHTGEAEKRATAQQTMSGPKQKPPQGAVVDAVAASPNSAEDATVETISDPELEAEFAESEADQAEADAAEAAQEYGGIDFSTLRLSYISDTDSDDGPGSQFAFSAKATADGQVSYGGLPALQQAGDAFFVWLALSPDTFTVNLSPDEPDRILDADLGRTDAGRILLTADLQLKKLTAQLEHPDTPLGEKYWGSLSGTDQPNLCISERSWIVPGEALVREDGDQLYILQAPLDVKSETDYVQDNPTGATGAGCERNDPEVDRHNQEVFRSLILPKVIEAVNTAPDFQDLRRVYFSRVAAQWIRDRSATKETAYSSIIGSDDINQWQARTTWDPKDVYQQYLDSYRNGEYNVTRTTETEDMIITTRYFSGGVDFTTVPIKNTDTAAFDRDWPGLPGNVQDSMHSVARDGQDVLLGAIAPPDPERNGVAAARAEADRTALLFVITVSVVAGAAVFGIGGLLLRRRMRRRRTAQ